MDIKEVEIENERVYLQKDKIFGGYKVVHPVKINNQWNLKNLIAGGSWLKLILIIIFTIIIILAIIEVSNIYQIANQCINQTISINSSLHLP